MKIFTAIAIVVLVIIGSWVVWRGFEQRNLENEVTQVLDQLDGENDEIPAFSDSDVTADASSEESDVTDAINSLDTNFKDIDSNVDFADFGALE